MNKDTEKTESTGEKLEKPKKPGVFQKGDDPRRNLNGRPEGVKNFTTKVKEALLKIGEGNKVTYEEALVKKILHKAIVEGDTQMIKLMWNYIDGMPVQSMNLNADVLLNNSLTEEQKAKLDLLLNEQAETPTEQSRPAESHDGNNRGAEVSDKP